MICGDTRGFVKSRADDEIIANDDIGGGSVGKGDTERNPVIIVPICERIVFNRYVLRINWNIWIGRMSAADRILHLDSHPVQAGHYVPTYIYVLCLKRKC